MCIHKSKIKKYMAPYSNKTTKNQFFNKIISKNLIGSLSLSIRSQHSSSYISKITLAKAKKESKEKSVNRKKQGLELSNFTKINKRFDIKTKLLISSEKIINFIMRNGEKSKASQIFYKMLTLIAQKKFNEKAVLVEHPFVLHTKTSVISQQVKSDTTNIINKEKQSPTKNNHDFKKVINHNTNATQATLLNQSLTKKAFFPIVYPPIKPLIFSAMLVNKEESFQLQRKNNFLLNSNVGINSQKQSYGSNYTSITAKDKKYISKKVLKVQPNSISSTKLLNILGMFASTGNYNIKEKITTYFLVLKAKAKSNIFTKAVKLSLVKAKKLATVNKYSLVEKKLALLSKKSIETTKKQQQVALDLVKVAINNVKPSLEVRKVRVAGTTYQVPAILDKNKSTSKAIRWIIEAAQTRKIRSKNTFSECLAEEFFEASKKQGKARQKRDQLHNLASANRAYIRYRWW